MTLKQKQLHIENIKNVLKSHGFVEDAYGNLKKINGKGQLTRFKFNTTSLRYETQLVYEATKYSDAYKQWVRSKSAYYKDIEIIEYGDNVFKIKGLK